MKTSHDIEADVEQLASSSLKHINPRWVRFFEYITDLSHECDKREAVQAATEEAQRSREPSEGSANEQAH